MRNGHRQLSGLVAAATLALAPASFASIINFNLDGKGGAGLLSTNENGVINGTPGSGGEVGAGISYDDVTNVLTINVGWGSGNGFVNLSGNASAGHIHGPTANPAPAGFLDNSTIRIGLDDKVGWNPAATNGGFIGSVTLDETQESELLSQRYYINVHTPTNSGGEIRGHLVIPEPSSAVLLAGVAAMALRRPRRR